MNTPTVSHLPLGPLGAGDLIDRTVRLYRRHFMTLVRAAAPPVLVSAAGAGLWAVGVRALAATGSEGRLAVYGVSAAVGIALMFGGYLLSLIVMGGASRNLVAHLLLNDPVSARAIYRSVRARFWGLVAATLAVGFCLVIAGGLAIVVWYIMLLAIVISGVAAAHGSGAVTAWVIAAMAVVAAVPASFGALWVFFALAGRVAYVMQVMMVEGRGVIDAVVRSVELARGNVRRLMAMFLFTTFTTYSALMMLLIPLGWYGYLHGINPVALNAAEQPVWYAVGSQVLTQLSTILLTPVWMLGLSLLYVDERVRHEGYDIELMAARAFGEMPTLPAGGHGPLAPALAAAVDAASGPREEKSSRSVLGLSERR